MIIAIDFDGTCVKHAYPNIGEDIGAVPVLRRLAAEGHRLILWTMRSGKTLADAKAWFKKNDIPLFGVNGNPEQKTWTKSKKAYAQLYIDDAALGCPLIADGKNRPYVNWRQVELAIFGDCNSYEEKGRDYTSYYSDLRDKLKNYLSSAVDQLNTEQLRMKIIFDLSNIVSHHNKAHDVYLVNPSLVGLIPLKYESDSSKITLNKYTAELFNK